MLYKFTETKVYFVDAETEDEAFDKYLELHNAEITVEVIETPTAYRKGLHNAILEN